MLSEHDVNKPCYEQCKPGSSSARCMQPLRLCRCCHLYRRMTRTVHVSERRLHWRQRRGRERDSLNHWQPQEGRKGDGTDSFLLFFFLTLTYTVLWWRGGRSQATLAKIYTPWVRCFARARPTRPFRRWHCRPETSSPKLLHTTAKSPTR